MDGMPEHPTSFVTRLVFFCEGWRGWERSAKLVKNDRQKQKQGLVLEVELAQTREGKIILSSRPLAKNSTELIVNRKKRLKKFFRFYARNF